MATLLAVAVAGCGHSAKHAASHTDPLPTTVIATTTTSPERAAAVAAWRHYWDVYVAVGSEMKLPDPRLAEVATGEELRHLGGGFLAFSSAGQVLRGTIDLAPEVVSLASSEAVLRDCYFSHILRYDKATGQPKGAAPTRRTLVSVTIQLDGGAWKVAAIKHGGEGCTTAS